MNNRHKTRHIFLINFFTTKAAWILDCKLNSCPVRKEFSSGSPGFRPTFFILFCTIPELAFEFSAAMRGKVPDVSRHCGRCELRLGFLFLNFHWSMNLRSVELYSEGRSQTKSTNDIFRILFSLTVSETRTKLLSLHLLWRQLLHLLCRPTYLIDSDDSLQILQKAIAVFFNVTTTALIESWWPIQSWPLGKRT